MTEAEPGKTGIRHEWADIEPDSVQLHRLKRGNPTPIDELLPALIADGVRAHSESGVLGDPTTATANHGRDLVSALVSSLVSTVESLKSA